MEDDLWSSSGELSLPELDALRPPRHTAEQAGDAEPTLGGPADGTGVEEEEPDEDLMAFDDEIEEEEGEEPTASLQDTGGALQSMDPFAGEDEETEEGALADTSFDDDMDEEVPTQLLDAVEGLDRLRRGDEEPSETFDPADTDGAPHDAAADEHVAATDLQDLDDPDAMGEHTPTPGEPLSDSWDPFGESSQSAPVKEEFPAEAEVESGSGRGGEDEVDNLEDEISGEEDQLVLGRLEQEPPGDVEDQPVMGTLEQEPPAQEEDEAMGDGLADTPSEEAETGDDVFESMEQQAEQVQEEAESGEQPAAEPTAGNAVGDEGGMFAGLASTGDWAEAAARWAESGFKAEEMPSFIQGKPEEQGGVAEEEEGEPLDEETAGGEVLASEAAEQAVEVSDTDIMMLDDDEVVQIEDQEPPPSEPTSAEDSTWAERASKKIKVQAKIEEKEKRKSLLRSPVALVGILAVVIMVVIGLIWLLSGGGPTAGDAVFPANAVEANVVEAPGPSAYEAKEDALLYYGRGNQLAYQQKWEEAIAEYKKALRSDPGYPHPNRALGAAYAALGKAKLSNDCYQAYLRLAPASADAKQVKAIIAVQNGR